MISKTENTVIVALMNNHDDFAIAQLHQWYRIPVKTAPPIIKENKAKIIAFYQTKEFKEEQFSIRYFAEIKRVKIVSRRELFPQENINEKSDKQYYKVEFAPLAMLQIPILSLRPRRLLFIPTTQNKFFSAKEINNLFNASKLEDSFFYSMLSRNIQSERQYYLNIKRRNYFLDFAVFCKTRNIDIEVDGDQYHMNSEAVQYDKERNNILESEGWSVLRFTNKDIELNIDHSIGLVMDTINHYGGIQNAKNFEEFNYLDKNDGQLKMFL